MRIRETKSDLTTVNKQWYCYQVGKPRTYYGPEAISYTEEYKRIADDPKRAYVVYPDGTRHLRFKACRSESWSFTPNTAQALIFVTDANPDVYCNVFVLREFVHAQFAPPYTSDLGFWFAGRLASYRAGPFYDFSSRWEKCKPSMEGRGNLTVFLAELRDMRKLFELIPRDRATWRSAGKLAKHLNGLHLNYNFGWKPFVRDIVNAFDAIATFNERLENFLRNEGLQLSRSKGTKDLEIDSTKSWVTPFNADWTINESIKGTERLRSTFHFSYMVPKLPTWELKARAWSDSLGVKLTPSVVWELIPFSFVVDWFINVGDYLEKREASWLEPEIRMAQTCSTSLLEVSGEWTMNRNSLNREVVPLAKAKLTLFQRIPSLPLFAEGLQYGNLDADKIRLLVSLGYSLI